MAPPKTPKAIVDKINADVNEALAQPEIQAQLKKLSAEVFGGSVDKTAKYLQDEIDAVGCGDQVGEDRNSMSCRTG